MRIVFEGNTRFDNSYGIVNLNLADALRSRGHLVALNSWDEDPEQVEIGCARLGLEPFPLGSSDGADVCIRQFWPPNWERPNSRIFIVIQPWEFGGVPLEWVKALDNVDQVWVHTNFVKSCWVEAGADPQKVRIVPLGVRPPSIKFPVKKPNQLLFLGGGIWRKGIDLFIRALDALDDDELSGVSVVIKESGNNSFYQGQSLVDDLVKLYPRVGEITQVLRESLSRDDLDLLVAESQALVHPYRAEGFYLGGLEAMSLGTAVVLTRGGAADDYANDTNAILVKASVAISDQPAVDNYGPIGGRYHWLEVSVEDLTQGIRLALVDDSVHEQRIQSGLATSTTFSWSQSARIAERAIAGAFTGDVELDHFNATELQVARTLTEWGIDDLSNTIALLLDHQDLYGAQALLELYPGELPTNAVSLHESLEPQVKARLDLWKDARYRQQIRIGHRGEHSGDVLTSVGAEPQT
ncbi:glycosyltransferase family 4 protein [Ferrimicrobium sp.]|uniref:glycosyltransferase family 4 protein n=1 Tax=Ferrimicrobium sp. TaxID=2926050 RepID=UPI002630B2BB|nr:glycosyltransferase family 4 protein [Ferrimicrobium sp.]